MNKITKKLFKVFIKPIVKKRNVEINSAIPKYELAEKNIKNARLITTRLEMLKLLPQNGVVAELGVNKGEFSDAILNINNAKKLHLVDFWGGNRYNQEIKKGVEARFKEYLKEGRVEINLGFSTEVVKNYSDAYFDWVYIDTGHSYKLTISELEAYRPKIKPGGYMAGHDFVMYNSNGMVRFGVMEAVYEFCNKYDWEIIYLTVENKHNASFAIREIEK